ncbi:MAG: GPR endopeptidase [Clostridia bacterium]|nr:GPR endopeptidase [Clostridia bacterium]
MEHGVRYREERIGRCRIERIELLEEDCARKMGKPRGNYVTLHCRPFWKLGEEEREEAIRLLAGEIRAMCLPAEGITERFGVLVVGLGNAEITADAVGPKTVHRLTVTRHLHEHDREIFRLLGRCQLSAIAPGVLGQTGMEAADLIRGAVKAVRPDVVLAIDALAARATERLAATVQLTDTGIAPGSGIGNRRRAIDRASVGAPVVALGIPTVVDSATLICDALSRAGITEMSDRLRDVLENNRRFFVSPKESDCITAQTAALLADAIEEAFSLEGDAYSANCRA